MSTMDDQEHHEERDWALVNFLGRRQGHFFSLEQFAFFSVLLEKHSAFVDFAGPCWSAKSQCLPLTKFRHQYVTDGSMTFMNKSFSCFPREKPRASE